MERYLGLIRGVNVGGNSLVKMAALKTALERCGLRNVHTYIQSGNVFFSSAETDKMQLAHAIEQCLNREFHVMSRAVVFTRTEWQAIVTSAPRWWGKDQEWKHNLFVILPPYDEAQALAAIGTLKPAAGTIEAGPGVLYQSLSQNFIGRATTGSKLISSPVYKALTVRNYNTATKLLELF